MHRFAPLAVCALLVTAAPAVSAQSASDPRGVIELGIDAGVSTTIGADYNITTVSIPTSNVRAGFYLNNHVSLEPSIALTSISASGDHLTTYDASVGVLLHGRSTRVGGGVYLRPFAGISGVSGGGSSSDTQTNLGVGLGVSIPFAERMATRMEVSYAHGFSSTYNDGLNLIAATIGLSFFTH